jgi:RNA polymerase sigma-70 factor (subfamily 1)
MQSDSGIDELCVKAAKGDADAMQSLLLRYHDLLLAYLRRLLVDQAGTGISGEDALQETLIEAFRRIKTLEARGEGAFLAWLKTIARTRLINMIKAQRAAKRGGAHVRKIAIANRIDGQTVTTILGFIAADTPTPSVILRRKEANHAAKKALESLDPLKKQVMEWRFGQGLSIDEIAERIGKKTSAVKMLIHRCLEDLRTELEKNGQISRGV